ncbi:MAG: hypothetical protein KTR32_24700 [Granulosicoccus sp.]|nr:hypothetical protein [Granulosicoccus sp.]
MKTSKLIFYFSTGVQRALLVMALLLSTLPFSLPIYAQSAPTLAFVTRSVPIPLEDRPFVNHLSKQGWNVTLVDDNTVRDSGRDAIRGYDLVVISSSVYPQWIQGRLQQAPEPIVVTEHQLFPSFRMTGFQNGDRGLTSASRKLRIVNSSNPMAAGLSGDVVVSSSIAKPMNYGRVGPDAYVIATAKDSDNQSVIFAYDAGDELANGDTAVAPRVGFYMSPAHAGIANQDGWALFDAAAAWATPNAPDETDENPNPPPVTGGQIAPTVGALLGANVSKENYSSRYDAVRGFENSINRGLDIVNRFHEFSSGISSNFYWDRQHIADGRTVMISWRATDNAGSVNGTPDPRRARKIVAGQFDRQIEAMARALRDLEAPILLRFNWEMDQDYGDPQYIGTPAEYIAAWRYMHNVFERLGATNVEWVWAPRARSFAKNVGQTFYPGYEYVDWVGGSAVPINSFTDAQTIYSAWNQWASNIGKPQLLWIGLRENPQNSRWKGNFINELRSLASGQWTGLKAIVYYSSNSPLGNDYTIDTSSFALSAFRNLACSSAFTSVRRCR